MRKIIAILLMLSFCCSCGANQNNSSTNSIPITEYVTDDMTISKTYIKYSVDKSDAIEVLNLLKSYHYSEMTEVYAGYRYMLRYDNHNIIIGKTILIDGKYEAIITNEIVEKLDSIWNKVSVD